MSEEFIQTAELVKALILDQATQIQLYGLYKQATQGDVTISAPSDPVSLIKYNSWLSHLGKPSEQAESEYIELVKSFNTGWGIGVSRPVFEEIEEDPLSELESAIRDFCENIKTGKLDIDISNSLGINCQDRQGLTPLHHAVDEGLEDIVSRLIELGADPNIQDTEGMTPLHYAVELDNSEILKLLITAKGVDLTIADLDGKNIFAIAQAKCAKIL